MSRTWLILTTVFCTGLSGGAVFGDEPVPSPAHLGPRSNNPEQETYGVVSAPDGAAAGTVGFVGPARTVGADTGDPEKDTVVYRPLLAYPEAAQVVLSSGE